MDNFFIKLAFFPSYLGKYMNQKLDLIKSDIDMDQLENRLSKEFYRGYVTACDNIAHATENYFTEAGDKFVDKSDDSNTIR
jgi:hypothetical protein